MKEGRKEGRRWKEGLRGSEGGNTDVFFGGRKEREAMHDKEGKEREKRIKKEIEAGRRS